MDSDNKPHKSPKQLFIVHNKEEVNILLFLLAQINRRKSYH